MDGDRNGGVEEAVLGVKWWEGEGKGREEEDEERSETAAARSWRTSTNLECFTDQKE